MRLRMSDCGLRNSRDTTCRTAASESRSAGAAVRHVVSRLPSAYFHSALRTPGYPLGAAIPTGITLIEVLISMFVLLFGLMGVAAIFPVASHYIVEGEKKDRGGGLAQIAFEEIKSRKLLRPITWAIPASPTFGFPFIQLGFFTMGPADRGHAFVLDPLAVAAANQSNITGHDYIPFQEAVHPNPWMTPPTGLALVGANWPLRRLSLDVDSNPSTATFVSGQTAETIFRLRDDLAVEQPEVGDRPSIQRWSVGTGNQLLSRQYIGDYSWLATVVPTRMRALEGLQPSANIKDEFYEVSAVVFYKRDVVPSASTPGSPGSERLIAADFLNSGELAIYDNPGDDPAEVDAALDKIKPSNWIAVMGVNQTTGVFLMKWYKILALDDSTEQQTTISSYPSDNQQVRFAMVQGPDWPKSSYTNLRVAILPGVIDVYTRVMQVDVE